MTNACEDDRHRRPGGGGRHDRGAGGQRRADSDAPAAGGQPGDQHGGPGCPAPDQRGALLVGGCDAGAVEYGGVPVTPTPTPSPTAAPPADSYPMGDVGCSDSVTVEDLVPALKLVGEAGAAGPLRARGAAMLQLRGCVLPAVGGHELRQHDDGRTMLSDRGASGWRADRGWLPARGRVHRAELTASSAADSPRSQVRVARASRRVIR